MGCGFGTCLGCALPMHGDDGGSVWKLCCTDGPVMSMRDVDWDGPARAARSGRRMSEHAIAAGVDLGRGLILPNPVGLASGTAGYGFELAAADRHRPSRCAVHEGHDGRAARGQPTTARRRDRRRHAQQHRPAESGRRRRRRASTRRAGVDGRSRSSSTSPAARSMTTCTAPSILDPVAEVAGIELNISCPNIAGGLDFGRDAAPRASSLRRCARSPNAASS